MTVQETKACPKCGAVLFADMEVCYECLHGSDAHPAGEEDGRDEDGRDEADTATVFGPDDACATEAVAAGWKLRMHTASVDMDVPIPAGGLIIGRSPTCDVVLHAKSISRQHVHIERTEQGVCVCDLGARNAPHLNGRPIKGEAHMGEGDILSLCGSTFELLAQST